MCLFHTRSIHPSFCLKTPPSGQTVWVGCTAREKVSELNNYGTLGKPWEPRMRCISRDWSEFDVLYRRFVQCACSLLLSPKVLRMIAEAPFVWRCEDCEGTRQTPRLPRKHTSTRQRPHRLRLGADCVAAAGVSGSPGVQQRPHKRMALARRNGNGAGWVPGCSLEDGRRMWRCAPFGGCFDPCFHNIKGCRQHLAASYMGLSTNRAACLT